MVLLDSVGAELEEATLFSRRQIHQWGCRAPRLCERERRGLVRWGLCLEVLMERSSEFGIS
jgi:hypothetical protein